jgi:hypothetical protein
MKKAIKIPVRLAPRKIITIGIMCFCLLFLKGVNFFIYPPSHSFCSTLGHNPDANDEESPTPVEEKSSSKTGLTTQEEYIHDLHSIKDLSAFVVLSKHKIPGGEKLQVVHFELISPPPKG